MNIVDNKSTLSLKPIIKDIKSVYIKDNENLKSKLDNKEIDKKEIRVVDSNETRNKKKGKHLWAKGVSGNPSGRPKGSVISITSEIKKQLAEIPEGKKKNKLSQLVKIIFDKALKDKDDKMIGRIWNFIDGLPRQQTDIKLDTELTINITDSYKPKIIEPRKIIEMIEDKDT